MAAVCISCCVIAQLDAIRCTRDFRLVLVAVVFQMGHQSWPGTRVFNIFTSHQCSD